MKKPHDASCGCDEYQELSRRQFLTTTAAASAAAYAAVAFPDWLPRVVLADHYSSTRDTVVSIFQRGGADGLSLCLPYADANYYTGRPTIAVPPPDALAANRSIALDNFFAFPPGMSGLLDAYAATDLLVIHAAGLTDKSRSHFDAQRWTEVGKAADPNLATGWLGRHLATVPPKNSDALLRGIGVSSGLSRTLVGAPKTLPIANPASYTLSGSGSTRTARLALLEGDYGTAEEPLKSNALDAIDTIQLLATLNFNGYVPANGAVYPNTSFGRALRSVAVLIKADIGLEAAQVDIGGWDTHAQQDPNAGQMFTLMQNFSDSLGAFWADVVATGYPATVVSQSEFGRNVKENGSAGTDHGRATAMFAMGRSIAGGRVLADWPGIALENLEDKQDLRVTIDYRDVLAEIVQNRLENTNLDVIFPGYTPTFRGVTR